MNKRVYYVLSRIILIAILILFEAVMYFAAGETALSQKGALRTVWLLLPAFLLIVQTVVDFIVFRKKREKDSE